MLENKTKINEVFANDVLQGLSANPKFLSSRYFYDERGDALFQEIMRMPEYYLTRCEYEILQDKKETILRIFSKDGLPFRLIEFGAGDGTKTKLLLKHFLEKKARFRYLPIDISENVLNLLKDELNNRFPELEVDPLQGEYFKALGALNTEENARKIVLFLGSNIGNFRPSDADKFLKEMASNLNSGDLLFIGFDLKKDPAIILDAYNDKAGITKAFNLNLLTRINNELGANFNIAAFQHFPTYDPQSGEMKSYLISTAQQEVYVEALERRFSFEAWESVHTEVSQKYDLHQIAAMASRAGFKPVENLFDKQGYYVDSVWEVL